MVIDEIIETVSERPDYSYEIITVNDCSPDNVGDVLRQIAKDNRNVKVVNLAKNMGKHAAIMAGYSFVKGDYIVNLDDDYQSPINCMWELMDSVLLDECDVATAEYYRKKESAWKRFGSNVNLLVSEIMLDKPKGLRFENLSVMKRFVVDEIVKYKNPYPYLEGLILRVTKRIKPIQMEQRERADDNETGFTFIKSLALFANGFTNFSVKPLRIATILGAVLGMLGFAYEIYVVISKMVHPNVPMGWSSIMAVNLFFYGVIMCFLGIIGEYVGRIFICINDAPQFVIRDTLNIEDKSNDNYKCF